jgi:hypothetical protein
MVGQPELRETLSLPELRQLRQRITLGYHISSLTSKEVGEYIRHRLAVAGIEKREIFTHLAIKEVYKASRGIPRIINIICDAALVTGYVKERKKISDKLIKEVIEELDTDAIRVHPETTPQKSEPTTENNVVRFPLPHQDKLAKSNIKDLHYIENELYAQHQYQIDWEKRLAEQQNELNIKQRELYEKLEQLLHLERELIAREQRIRNREIELGISMSPKAKGI